MKAILFDLDDTLIPEGPAIEAGYAAVAEEPMHGPGHIPQGYGCDEFLRDGIESIDGDTVRLKLISPLRPGLLQGEDGSFSYLIMPIRLST